MQQTSLNKMKKIKIKNKNNKNNTGCATELGPAFELKYFPQFKSHPHEIF